MKTISTKGIIEKYKVSPQRVNHYTTLGLLEVVSKNKNTRLYDDADVGQRLEWIETLMEEGYTLRLISREFRDICASKKQSKFMEFNERF
ncbi:MAG: MerR family transcriptional regulator [Candidatus Omnitrophota bacterium]